MQPTLRKSYLTTYKTQQQFVQYQQQQQHSQVMFYFVDNNKIILCVIFPQYIIIGIVLYQRAISQPLREILYTLKDISCITEVVFSSIDLYIGLLINNTKDYVPRAHRANFLSCDVIITATDLKSCKNIQTEVGLRISHL